MSMMPISVPGAAALLKIAGTHLLLPQTDIRTVEAAADVDTNEPLTGSVGWISYAQQRWPVYCLSEDLELLTRVPPACRVCVLLAVEAEYMGVLADDVSIVRQIPQRQYELPASMRRAGSPVQYLLSMDDGIVCVSCARQLAGYIGRTGGVCGD